MIGGNLDSVRRPVDVLALPVYEASVVQLRADDEGVVVYRGRVFRTSPGWWINFPVFPALRAQHHDDVALAVDDEGVTWLSVATDRGLMRRRLW